MIHALTLLAFILHIGAGSIALVSGTVAVFAPKGARLHRAAGNVFFGSMLVMATFAIYLGVAMPNQLVNVFIGAYTLYLLSTAWVTVRRAEGAAGLFEKIALAVAICLCAPFLILSFQVAAGLPTLFKSALAIKGPVLVALYGFTTVLVLAAIADARLVAAGGIAGVRRIARHLWRMCLGLTMAAGSAFTNGVARLLPGPFHVPPAFFLPQLFVLGLLVFWLIRVRFTGWYGRSATADAT